MRHLLNVLTGCLLLATAAASANPSNQEHEQAVRNFVAAFNAHDSAAMADFVAEDVQWLLIDGASIAVEANGKAALILAMNDYFQSCPTCPSHLTGIISSRDRVSALEVAKWQGKDGPKSQRAMAVYEFAGSLIRRVYYFPAEK